MNVYERPKIAELLPKAEAGDAEAQYDLAFLIYDVILEYEDKNLDCDEFAKLESELSKEMNKWLIAAGRQGHAKACIELAETMVNYEHDEDAAFYWSKKAYEYGDLRGLHNMALDYILGADEGVGGPIEDLDYGFYLLRRLAEEEGNCGIFVSDIEEGVESNSNREIRFMCGSAYSLRVLLNSKKEIVRQSAQKAIDSLSKKGQEALHRCWDEIEQQEKNGRFSLHNPLLGLPEEEVAQGGVDSRIGIIPDDAEGCEDDWWGFLSTLKCRVINDYKVMRKMGLEAPTWLEMPAEHGDWRYQYVLGCWMDDSYNSKRSFEKASFWLTKAAEQGYKPAIYQLIDLYMRAENIVKDGCPEQAFYWCKKAREVGAHFGYLDLVRCYKEGIGTEKDYSKVLPILEEAFADEKITEYYHERVVSEICNCYRQGIGVEKDEAKADFYEKGQAEKFKREVDEGDERALEKLAECYFYGKGVEKNIDKTIELYETYAAKKPKKAGSIILSLASLFYSNQMFEEYNKYLLKAAELGCDRATLALAHWYEYDMGRTLDFKKCKAILEELSRQGDINAIGSLAKWYAEGRWLEKDLPKTYELLREEIMLMMKDDDSRYSFRFLDSWSIPDKEKQMIVQNLLDFCQGLLDDEHRWQIMNIFFEGYLGYDDLDFIPKNPALALKYAEEMLAMDEDYYPSQMAVKRAKKVLGILTDNEEE